MGKRTAPEASSMAKRVKTAKNGAGAAARTEEPARSGKGKGKAVAPVSESDEDEADEGAFDSEADSELNEFENDDGELIGDDGEDLMADLDGSDGGSDSDSDGSDEGSDPEAAPAPVVALKKANVRNSRQKAPLKPAELRALAFAELTASPISGFISTQVQAVLPALAPPAPATSPDRKSVV